MSVKYHYNVEQCSEEWNQLRCGILTASTMKHIVTPAQLKRAKNDKARAHLYELVAQRIAGYADASDYMSDDMERGFADEWEAKQLYSKNYAEVRTCGFISNDKWGFTLGYSPDGLVGKDGLLEGKSRRHKFQVQTILEDEMPSEYLMQVQTGLLVADDREWCDFVSYSGGLPMFVKRVYPDPKVHAAIVDAAGEVEQEIRKSLELYAERIAAGGFVATQPVKEITVPQEDPLLLSMEDLSV